MPITKEALILLLVRGSRVSGSPAMLSRKTSVAGALAAKRVENAVMKKTKLLIISKNLEEKTLTIIVPRL